jgi:aminoglycoside phosphotransferase (APT) family kinase protein
MLREYHSAVQTFIPPANAHWFVPDLQWSPGQIVRHGDLGPWNTVWADDQLVGFIDWDMIEPGTVLEDLAQLAWYCVPLRDDLHAHQAGFTNVPDRGKRLQVLCSAYGVASTDLLDVLHQLQQQEYRRIRQLAERGVEPWVTFRARGDSEEIAAESAWLANHRQSLLSR